MNLASELREEVLLYRTCTCSSIREDRFLHVVRNGQQAVHLSSHCASCGTRQESEFQTLPMDVREAILGEQGSWGLFLKQPVTARVLVALRKRLKLGMEDAASLKGGARPVMTGTRVEAAFLRSLLQQDAVESDVQAIKE